MDIVIVAQYCGDISQFEGNNSRFIYLAKMLKAEGHEVEIVTSDFIHGTKQHIEPITEADGIRFTVLHEPGYPKNVCLKRFRSHGRLAKNVKKYLDGRKAPDVLYTVVPSLQVARVAANYCQKTGVKFFTDVQDLWPEAFKMVYHVPPFTNLIYKPMERRANCIYEQADEVIAVSETYAARAMQVNQKCKNPMVVYLGTDQKDFDRYAQAEEAENRGTGDVYVNALRREGLRLAYCGTLGHSYDLPVVFRAMRLLPPDLLEKITFIVMGDGPQREEFAQQAEGLPVIFTERLPYYEMVWLLSKCHIAVNPIVEGAAQSIINKHMDYAMAGLPVVNTQECAEYRDLLDTYHAGINCACGSEQDVADAIMQLMTDENLRTSMGRNNRKMGEEKFDRKTTYVKIVERIEAYAKENH